MEPGLDHALGLLGDRWALAVVDALRDAPLRYGELQAQIGAIAPNVLSTRLKRLEAEGVVVARPYTRRPPRFTYELTAAGRDLSGVVALLTDWGARHSGLPDAGPVHSTCATPLQARWFCPTCELVVDAGAADTPPDDGLLFA